MANISKVKLPDNTTYDIISMQTRSVIFCRPAVASTASAFKVNVPSIPSLYNGLSLYIYNNIATSVANATLELNNFGAKRIKINGGADDVGNYWRKDRAYLFVFDSVTDRWVMNYTDAAGIAYDGTHSGLSADTVQGAIDETNTLLSAIPNLNNIAFKTATRNDAGGFTNGQCRYIICGKLVIGIIEDLIGVNSTHNAVVFSDLPTPQNSVIGLIQFTGGTFKAPFRVRIGEGKIYNWYSSINNGQGSEGYMIFVYVST